MSNPQRGEEMTRQRNWRLYTAVILLAFLLAAACVALLVVLVPTRTMNQCITPECIEASAFILSNVNLSADPCEDFFEFACGGFVGRSRYSLSQINHGSGIHASDKETEKVNSALSELLYRFDLAESSDPEMNELYNITRKMLHSCMAWHSGSRHFERGSKSPNSSQSDQQKPSLFDVIEPLFEILTSVHSAGSDNTLEQLLGRLLKTGMSRLIRVPSFQSHYLNPYDNGSIIVFASPMFEFARPWNTSDLEFISKGLKQLNSSLASMVHGSKDNIVRVQNELFQLQQTAVTVNCSQKCRDFNGTLEELKNEMRAIDFNWDDFLFHVFGKQFNPTERIFIINFYSFHRSLEFLSAEWKFGTSIPVRPVYVFLVLDSLLSAWRFFPEMWQEHIMTMYRYRYRYLIAPGEGSVQERDYSEFCMWFASTSMPPVVFDMFSRVYMPDGYSNIDKLIDRVQLAMGQNVDSEAWIPDAAKRAIKFKIQSVKRLVASHPVSETVMKEMYSEMREHFQQDSRLGHLIGMQLEMSTKILLQFMTTNMSADIFELWKPFEVNAFYSQNLNEIAFPAGILSTFLFNARVPSFLNYGGLGMIIGHEIGHGFDEDGHEANETGSMGHIWDSATESEFLKRIRCFVDFFNQLEVTKGVSLDGNTTLNDNIADSLGVSSAFRALRNDLASASSQQRLPGFLGQFSAEKMFFVQFSQFWCERVPPSVSAARFRRTHSPGRLRILGTLRNSEEFANAFNCRKGSGMNPEKKCRLW